MPASDPHQNQPVAQAGPTLENAAGAMILLHGRGATAESILQLAREFHRNGITYLAPQAADNTWYPQSFLAPIEENEPWLSSGLRVLARILEETTAAALSPAQVVILGFSQGACLGTEFAARNPQHYGGVVGLSGGLIGPEGTLRNYAGSLDGTRVFLGCGDRDPHIPVERVNETARVFEDHGAAVTKRIYPGMGHTVNRDELDAVRSILDTLNAT